MQKKYIVYTLGAILLILSLGYLWHRFAQPEPLPLGAGTVGVKNPYGYIEVHQMNVDNGDGGIILTRNADHSIRKKVMIDAGQTSGSNIVIPYLKQYVGEANFDWVIVSHYHDDHYKGFLELFTQELGKNAKGEAIHFTTKHLIDPGGYTNEGKVVDGYQAPNDSNTWPQVPRKGKTKTLKPRMKDYFNAVKTLGENSLKVNGSDPSYHDSYNNQAWFLNPIIIDSIDNIPVTLKCVALNGFTINQAGNAFGTRRTKRSNNPNNFSYAWLLEFGEFRMFTGADLGGQSNGSYTNQESDVAAYCHTNYQKLTPFNAKDDTSFVNMNLDENSFNGHVCIVKANHHGSEQSNRQGFLDTLCPSTVITSVGSNASWHLPAEDYMTRLSAMKRIQPKNTLMLFTRIYNFGAARQLKPEDDGYGEPLSTDWQSTFNQADTLFTAEKGYVLSDGNHYVFRVYSSNQIGKEWVSIEETCVYGAVAIPTMEVCGPATVDERAKRKRRPKLTAYGNKCSTIPDPNPLYIGCHTVDVEFEDDEDDEMPIDEDDEGDDDDEEMPIGD